MVGWVLVAALDAALIVAAFRAQGGAEPRRALRRVVNRCLWLMVISAMAGLIWGLGRAIAAVSNPSLDAVQRERVLGEGMEETVRFTGLGIAVLLVPAAVAATLLALAPKATRPRDAAPR
jgi:hypothetical protein